MPLQYKMFRLDADTHIHRRVQERDLNAWLIEKDGKIKHAQIGLTFAAFIYEISMEDLNATRPTRRINTSGQPEGRVPESEPSLTGLGGSSIISDEWTR